MEIKDFCTGIQHVGIPTNDIEATIAFYKKLGFTLEYRVMNGKEDVAFLLMKGLMIETYQNFNATMEWGAIDHIAIDVKHIEQLYETVKAAGLEIFEGICDLPFWENGIKYFIIEGPNKEKIEFCEKL